MHIKSFFRGLAFVMGIVATIGYAAPASGQVIAKSYRPVIGQPHPDFVLPAIDDGRKVQLSDFRGKKVVLIHFASW